MNDFKCESCGSDWLIWYNDFQVCGNCLEWAEHGVTQELIEKGPKMEKVIACAACGGVDFIPWGKHRYCKGCIRRAQQPLLNANPQLHPQIINSKQAMLQIDKFFKKDKEYETVTYVAPNIYNFKSTLSDSTPPPQLGVLDPDVLVAELPVTPGYLHSSLNREWPW